MGPRFAAKYPQDDGELSALVAAFQNGNYLLVRESAPRLAATTTREDVRRAALDLRKRLDPDRLGIAMLVGTAILLLFLVAWFYSHSLK